MSGRAGGIASRRLAWDVVRDEWNSGRILPRSSLLFPGSGLGKVFLLAGSILIPSFTAGVTGERPFSPVHVKALGVGAVQQVSEGSRRMIEGWKLTIHCEEFQSSLSKNFT